MCEFMVSDSLDSRSVTAAGRGHSTGSALRDPFAYRNDLALRVSEIWQFAFAIFVASNNCARWSLRGALGT
jgi:hypothetical protein